MSAWHKFTSVYRRSKEELLQVEQFEYSKKSTSDLYRLTFQPDKVEGKERIFIAAQKLNRIGNLKDSDDHQETNSRK